MTAPIGDDPRDASIPESAVRQLSMLRRLDMASYMSQLAFQRAAVDRQREAEARTQANAERRAQRYLTADVGLPHDDAQEIIAVMREQRVGATEAAVIVGQRRAEATK